MANPPNDAKETGMEQMTDEQNADYLVRNHFTDQWFVYSGVTGSQKSGPYDSREEAERNCFASPAPAATGEPAQAVAAGQGLSPLECTQCGRAIGPMYEIDKDHAGWMCDTCYANLQKAQLSAPPQSTPPQEERVCSRCRKCLIWSEAGGWITKERGDRCCKNTLVDHSLDVTDPEPDEGPTPPQASAGAETLYFAAKAACDYWREGGYEPGIEQRLFAAVDGYTLSLTQPATPEPDWKVIARKAAEEIVGVYDISTPRGRRYFNSITQTIAIIIQQRILEATTRHTPEPDPRDADIERLRKQLATAQEALQAVVDDEGLAEVIAAIGEQPPFMALALAAITPATDKEAQG